MIWTASLTWQIADVTSTFYNGGGTSDALQSAVDWTAFAALTTAPTVIDADDSNAIDIWLMNTTASQSVTLVVMEHSADPAAAATITRVTEIAVATADQTFDTDQSAWGLAADTDIPAKQPYRVAITPGAYVSIFVSTTITGAWYARYGLLKV